MSKADDSVAILEELAIAGWTVKLLNGPDNRWRTWLRWQQGPMPSDGYKEESSIHSTVEDATTWLLETSGAWVFD